MMFRLQMHYEKETDLAGLSRQRTGLFFLPFEMLRIRCEEFDVPYLLPKMRMFSAGALKISLYESLIYRRHNAQRYRDLAQLQATLQILRGLTVVAKGQIPTNGLDNEFFQNVMQLLYSRAQRELNPLAKPPINSQTSGFEEEIKKYEEFLSSPLMVTPV